MCGFVAELTALRSDDLANKEQLNSHSATLQAMTARLQHRGPDDIGYYTSPNGAVQLGHTRLSIIDLSNGHQPLIDDSTVLVYNGEIYNHNELRQELEALGHQFNSRCDTEVLAKAYQQWGSQCLDRFNGMFAFAIYDTQRQRVFIARDRLGIKPLFWTKTTNNRVIIGSELKALIAHPEVQTELNIKSVSDYFSLGYVPEPFCIYKHIHKLQAGHYIDIDLTEFDVTPLQYWDCINPINHPERHTTRDELNAGKALLQDAINTRTMADVPVGAFLSGGVDSSIIVSEMNQHQNVSSFSMGFDQQDYDESEQAKQVAAHLGTQHTGMTLSCNTFDYLPELIEMFDEPFADNSAIPTYLLTKQAKKQVSVMLSGDGADELFLGYRNYRLLRLENRLKRVVPKKLRAPLFGTLAKYYPAIPWAPQFLRAQSTLAALDTDFITNFHRAMSINSPEVLAQIFSPSILNRLAGHSSFKYFKALADRVECRDPIKVVQYIDFKTYLPGNILTKVDRTTMANSIEARVPFMDHRLVEQWIAKSSDQNINGRRSKLLLRDIAQTILPKHVASRRKKSFTSPMDEWFRMMTKAELKKRMQLDVLKSSHWFNIEGIEQLIDAHYSGKQNIGMTLWSITVFAEFLKAQHTQKEQ